MDLNQICNVIILISAVIIAVKNIYAFVKKPVDSLVETARQEEEKRIKEIIEQKFPEYMQEINGNMSEIKNSLHSQNKTMEEIQASVKLLNNAQLDMMRYSMNRIYYKYYPYQKILSCDKKAFLKFYNDYHEMGGNTWIDTLYSEVKDWEAVEKEKDLKS